MEQAVTTVFAWGSVIIIGAIVLTVVFALLGSFHTIGETEIGLVTKRYSLKQLRGENPIAFEGEAGFQASLLMPGGPYFRPWPLYRVDKHPWVQVPAGQIAVVIAQVGQPLPPGAKSATYKKEFGNFTDLHAFVAGGGQKGVQRPVLLPGMTLPIHPVAFIVITSKQVFGVPVDPDIARKGMSAATFGLSPDDLQLVRIEPSVNREGQVTDIVGIVRVEDGDPLASGDIANRLGGFADIEKLEQEHRATNEDDQAFDAGIVERILGSQNQRHNNYQDFQAFVDAGGKIGLQHDPLLYGTYALNPFLVQVDLVPMLVVQQGEVAVIKSYVGLASEDTSGNEFKYGTIVRPGHRGIWREPLRTGKYPINPRCYAAEIVPTSILTLNWAEATSKAHTLDRNLSQIDAKSREGFQFKIDLQVQIHVPDRWAPAVISMVKTMANLVDEVLQAATGNYFRDTLQGMAAIEFIEKRASVQKEAEEYIREKLRGYKVETPGVYIQDVVFPADLVKVLQQREIANQQVQTYQREREAQTSRLDTEKARGMADAQSALAKSMIEIEVQKNNAQAQIERARGEAEYLTQVGRAKAVEVEAAGLAKAAGYKAQVDALGPQATAMVNLATALADKNIKLVPDVLVEGSRDGGGGLNAFSALAAVATHAMITTPEPTAALPATVNGHAPAEANRA